MTIQHVPSLARIRRHRDLLDEALRALDDDTLEQLHARTAEPVVRDGYGTGATDVAVATSTTDTAVERAVTAIAGGREEVRDPVTDEVLVPATPDTWPGAPDPTLEVIVELFAELAEVAGTLVRVIARRDYVMALHGERRGRESSLQGECRCCDRAVAGTSSDRLKSGYCPACYKAWERDGRPGADPQLPGLVRRRWERDRRARLRERQAS